MLCCRRAFKPLILNTDFNDANGKINISEIQSKEEDKDKESVQSGTTPGSGQHMGKRQNHKKIWLFGWLVFNDASAFVGH